jgi:hypothetical protein
LKSGINRPVNHISSRVDDLGVLPRTPLPFSAPDRDFGWDAVDDLMEAVAEYEVRPFAQGRTICDGGDPGRNLPGSGTVLRQYARDMDLLWEVRDAGVECLPQR